jgi:hypothetical protein
MNDSKRTHEVRVGMSLYWVSTERVGEGYAWTADDLSGWTQLGRGAAVEQARVSLRERSR